MEPLDDNNYNRHDALGFAVQYHLNREGTPDQILETAQLFLNWFNGVEVN